MAFFTPRNQLRNMLDAEIGQAMVGRPNIGKMIALNSLLNQPQQQNRTHIQDNWLDDNWLDQGNFFD